MAPALDLSAAEAFFLTGDSVASELDQESASRLSRALDAAAPRFVNEARRYEHWKATRVVVDLQVLGGEPTFPESRLAIRRVGELLLGGVPNAEIRDDYPYLTDEDLRFASLYTRARREQAPP